MPFSNSRTLYHAAVSLSRGHSACFGGFLKGRCGGLAGGGGVPALPEESAPIFFCQDKRKLPRPVKRKPHLRTGVPPVREYGGRANRSGGHRWPRRPCADAALSKNCIPAQRPGWIDRVVDESASFFFRCRSPGVRRKSAQRADIESAPTTQWEACTAGQSSIRPYIPPGRPHRPPE